MSTKNKSKLRKLAVLLLPLAILSVTAETCTFAHNFSMISMSHLSRIGQIALLMPANQPRTWAITHLPGGSATLRET